VDAVDLKKLNADVACSSERALLSSMLIRASYGGMACDVSLLQAACICWLQRFKLVQDQLGTGSAGSVERKERTTAATSVAVAEAPSTEAAVHSSVPTVHDSSGGTSCMSPWQPLWEASFSSHNAVAIPWGVCMQLFPCMHCV
jgi:hypothetical protein